MRILAVPNWSFGRSEALMRQFQDILMTSLVKVHYCRGDVDHNRTVTAFSGDETTVQECLIRLCEAAFETIDLNRHVGVHPRVGAMDVCPFVLLEGELIEALAMAEYTAAKVAEMFDIPVFLYEKSERGRHETDLPSLRRGGFGGLIGKTLQPDFGPLTSHERLGIAVMGVRDFLIAMNVNFSVEDPAFAKSLAAKTRELRSEGDGRFLGVRALGFTLSSRRLSQLSLNLTLPDLVTVDGIVDWVARQAASRHVNMAGTELIGVIREKDVPNATWLQIDPVQIVGR